MVIDYNGTVATAELLCDDIRNRLPSCSNQRYVNLNLVFSHKLAEFDCKVGIKSLNNGGIEVLITGIDNVNDMQTLLYMLFGFSFKVIEGGKIKYFYEFNPYVKLLLQNIVKVNKIKFYNFRSK